MINIMNLNYTYDEEIRSTVKIVLKIDNALFSGWRIVKTYTATSHFYFIFLNCII